MLSPDMNQALSKIETIALRKKHVSDVCTLFFKSDPLKIIRAAGQYMYDEAGHKYLDCMNNVAHVGHCHPAVVKAATDQNALLSTNSRFLHDNLSLLAHKLTSVFPEPLKVGIFCNSGSEANDLALRLARRFTQRHDAIVLDNAYHGHLVSLIPLSPYKFKQPGGEGPSDWVHVVPNPDTYRGKYQADVLGLERATDLYVDEVRKAFDDAEKKGRKVGIFYAESLQSCAGQIIHPPGYLRRAFEIARQRGALCVADEVQTGYGRTGTHMWAFEMQGARPDIVTIGKSMGNGHPVSALITTREIADCLAPIEYFNTCGGNPVSCAVALAVLDVCQKENFQQNAAVVGNFMLKELQVLKQKYSCIGDVRGMGLFIGIEMVYPGKKPATDLAAQLQAALRYKRILISVDGYDGNVVKIKPPMCFSMENAKTLLQHMNVELAKIEGHTLQAKL